MAWKAQFLNSRRHRVESQLDGDLRFDARLERGGMDDQAGANIVLHADVWVEHGRVAVIQREDHPGSAL